MRQHFRISVGFSVINMQQKWIDDDLGMVGDPNDAYIYTHTICITMYIHVPLHVQLYSPNMGSWTCLLKNNQNWQDYRPVADSFDKLELLKDICIQEEVWNGEIWWWMVAEVLLSQIKWQYLPTCLKLQKMGQMDKRPWWRFFTRRNQENMNTIDYRYFIFGRPSPSNAPIWISLPRLDLHMRLFACCGFVWIWMSSHFGTGGSSNIWYCAEAWRWQAGDYRSIHQTCSEGFKNTKLNECRQCTMLNKLLIK